MTTQITAAETIELSLREEVAIEIRSHLDSIGQSYLVVGKALNEVKEDFENAGEFLAWALSEFGLAKAQAYNLMKVATVFGDDERFKGVAMRVLMVLAKHVDDEAVMGRAAVQAAAGKLDSKAIADILAPAGKTTPPVTKQAPNMSANDGNGNTEQSLTVTMQPETTPEVEAELQEGIQPAPASPVQAEQSEQVKGLLGLVQSLKDTIAQMQEEYRRRDTERDSKVKSAPMLPQFKSKCLYARLGLSQEESQDAKLVKKAQRELVKLGYGDGHAAWSAISEAVTELTGGAK